MEGLKPGHLLQELIGVLGDNCPDLSPEEPWSSLRDPLFDLLQRLGTKAGFKVWHAKTTGTYLWDIAWTHESSDRYWLELAGEIELSEMSLEGFLDDFYKVLDAKARLKVFVAATSLHMARDLKREIDWAVQHQRFRLPDERLIAILVIEGDESDWDKAETRVFDGFGPYGKWKEGWELLPLGPPGDAS